MRPEEFDVILWDFDGVIINSNFIREQGFKEVLKSYPKQEVETLIAFHHANGGLSRFVKFRYFFEVVRREVISDEHIFELADQFSSIMKIFLVDPELLIRDTIDFIRSQHDLGKEQHIVSGSDQKELIELCKSLKIDHLFTSIQGSPTPKEVLVKSIINTHFRSNHDFCLIGDSINDLDAANVNNIEFFGYNNYSLLDLATNYIYSFNESI